MAGDLTCDKFWVNKNIYHDAEKKYYENLAKLQSCGEKSVELLKETGEKYNKNLNVRGMLPYNLHSMDAQDMKKENVHSEGVKKKQAHNGSVNHYSEKKERQKESREKKNIIGKKYRNVKDMEDDVVGGVGMARLNQETFPKTSLAGEVAKARQHIKSSLECMDQNINGAGSVSNAQLASCLEKMEKAMENLTRRVEALEKKCLSCPPGVAVCPPKPQKPATKTPAKPAEDDEDDDVDLFGSDNEDEEYKKIKEQRLQEYAAKKSKKPAPVAKSSIILDIKPWDDETDMKEMEKAVRAIEMDGLIWGASKLVPVAFKIFKLQIACVIEDDKVSVDVLTETLLEIEDYIQSVDIAAFNKV